MDNSLIKEIHDAATSEKVQQTIALFSPAESHVTNKDKLVSDCQHKDLAETISHLKTQREKYPSLVQVLVKKASRTKDPIASDICEFLEQLKPADCSACNNEYLPVASENATNNNVTCQICSKFSHKTCYDGSNVNPAIGIYYICNMCCINFKQFCEVPAPTEEKSKDEAPAAVEETRPVVSEEKKETCPLLLESRCPYGLRGDGCGFEHPKPCFYYIKHGNDPQLGCTRRKCKFFHPKLCSNSVDLKICLNQSCTHIHLKGTRRRKLQEWEVQQQQRQEKPKPQVNPWGMENNRVSEAQNTSQNQAESRNDMSGMKDFLEKYLEKMKAELSTHIDTKISTVVARSAQNQPAQMQWNIPTQHQTNPAQQPNYQALVPATHMQTPDNHIAIPVNMNYQQQQQVNNGL